MHELHGSLKQSIDSTGIKSVDVKFEVERNDGTRYTREYKGLQCALVFMEAGGRQGAEMIGSLEGAEILLPNARDMLPILLEQTMLQVEIQLKRSRPPMPPIKFTVEPKKPS